jgi:hypothetical protein
MHFAWGGYKVAGVAGVAWKLETGNLPYQVRLNSITMKMHTWIINALEASANANHFTHDTKTLSMPTPSRLLHVLSGFNPSTRI